MISELSSAYYTMGRDNLSTRVSFVRAAYQTQQKVMIHCAIRTCKRGPPKLVIQREVSKMEELRAARNTVKVARLAGTEVVLYLHPIYRFAPHSGSSPFASSDTLPFLTVTLVYNSITIV